jgi:tetratricopeptide (TPR) repeat protein
MQAEQAGQQDLIKQRDRTEGYLRVDPNNKQLLVRAVELNLALSDAPAAQVHANSALALFPLDPFIQCLSGHVLAAQHKWAEAAAVYAPILATTPDPDLAFSLATCQIWQGQHQAALETMAPYASTSVLPAASVILLVRAHHHVGNRARAIELVEQNRVRLADETDFLAAAALVYLDDGDLAKAAEFARTALAGGAHAVEALIVIATLALVQGDADRAIGGFEEALAVNPEEGRSWSGIGMASMLKHDYANAIMQLQNAVRLLPRHAASWYGLGWSYLATGDVAKAVDTFEQALAISPNASESHGGLACALALKGDRSKAEAHIARALKLDPDNLSAKYAQMVLDGVAKEAGALEAAAMKAIAGRKNAFGVELSAQIAANRPPA